MSPRWHHCRACGKPGPDPCTACGERQAEVEARAVALQAHMDTLTPEQLIAEAFDAQVMTPPAITGHFEHGDLRRALRGDVW